MGGPAHQLLATPRQPSGVGAVPNLIGWWLGSQFDTTADGTEVASWTDQSSAGINATALGPAGGGRLLVLRNSINTNMTSLDGGPSATRGGVLRTGTLWTNSEIWSVFMVIYITGNSTNLYTTGSPGSNGIIFRIGSTGKFTVDSASGTFETSTSIVLNAWHYLLHINNSGTKTVYVDGAALSWSSTPGTSGSPSGLFATPYNGAIGIKGRIAEVAIVNRAITTTERQNNFEAYARRRYGLS
jgi:hypothetical protein